MDAAVISDDWSCCRLEGLPTSDERSRGADCAAADAAGKRSRHRCTAAEPSRESLSLSAGALSRSSWFSFKALQMTT